MHRKKYDAYKGKMREEKVKHLKAGFCKQRSLFTDMNQSNEDFVRASYVISEMIRKSSRPFTEGLFVKECLVKASDILCPSKKKTGPAVSSVAKRTLSEREGLGFDSRTGQIGTVSPTTRHRCDVSSELCCPGAKPRRWAPQLVTRLSVIR